MRKQKLRRKGFLKNALIILKKYIESYKPIVLLFYSKEALHVLEMTFFQNIKHIYFLIDFLEVNETESSNMFNFSVLVWMEQKISIWNQDLLLYGETLLYKQNKDLINTYKYKLLN